MRWVVTWKSGGIFAERCSDCGARLSLGPSNDDVPADEMEIAVAVDGVIGHDGNWWSDGGGGSDFVDDSLVRAVDEVRRG